MAVTDIQTFWLNADYDQRLAVLRDCDWRTQRGTPSRTAKVAARKVWEDLSPAMQNVLTRKAREGVLGI